MEQKRSLTPAQIQYLRIGPKVHHSSTASKELQDTLGQYHIEGAQPGASLSNIPKFTYGNFENTVNNFGVLLHRNFVGTTTLHQAQKFGNIVSKIDKNMQEEKDKPLQDHKHTRGSVVDSRTSLKGIYDFEGHKLLLTLKSFSIESAHTHKILETLQIPFMKLMVSHVPSLKLIKSIEGAMRQEGSTVTIDYEKMESKIGHSPNNEIKYQEGPFTFERSSQPLIINLPHLEIYHAESEFKKVVHLENKDILSIIQSDFDNVEEIAKKYLNSAELKHHMSAPENEDETEENNLFD